jgi:hypothetical protein
LKSLECLSPGGADIQRAQIAKLGDLGAIQGEEMEKLE